jgi:hypothetical protein
MFKRSSIINFYASSFNSDEIYDYTERHPAETFLIRRKAVVWHT